MSTSPCRARSWTSSTKCCCASESLTAFMPGNMSRATVNAN
jgi:hypothetical protein